MEFCSLKFPIARVVLGLATGVYVPAIVVGLIVSVRVRIGGDTVRFFSLKLYSRPTDKFPNSTPN